MKVRNLVDYNGWEVVKANLSDIRVFSFNFISMSKLIPSISSNNIGNSFAGA